MNTVLTHKWGSPIHDNTHEKHGIFIPELSIEKLVNSVTFSLQKILSSHGDAIHVVETSLSEKDEKRLQDFHGTFGIFQKSVEHALKLEKEGGKNIAVKAYIHDIGNNSFIDTLKNAQERGIHPGNIIIEIIGEECGILNHTALKNLEELKRLGFHIAVSDFEVNKGVVHVHYLPKIMEYILPRFIRISKNILDGIKSKMLKLSDTAYKLLKILKEKGIQVIQIPEKKGKMEGIESQKYPSILIGSRIARENFIDINGTVQGSERLVRFRDGITVSDGLTILKHTGKTLYLLEGGIRDAISDVKNKQIGSVNIYLKDLGSVNFREFIEQNTTCLERKERRYLVFEILEECYGTMSQTVVDNIKWLGEKGFSIAIDDLFVSENNSGGLSKEILETLIDMNIAIDFIKIDGRHAEAIRLGNIDPYEVQHLRQLIGQPLSSKDTCPGYIVEWIQNKEHAIAINQVLGKGDDLKNTFWYQGRNLRAAEFR